ncbi:hypothetical protein AALP_AA4G110800 [Arabis alpina]|uniref:Glabrous enhancer-binding protein-like DBD domain-containing protein n=1 Tax=Arabis alpina TaxID=50452 RepID=A0A087H2J6_ARAAL|nr:hypothetical protein AALP_AA4G110800 [Arabis alpina]
MPLSSPIKRKHVDDDNEEVSGTKSRLRSRKILKTTFLSPSSSSSKMIWTRNNELIILAGIVDYESEKELSYNDDWDALYNFIKGSIELKFSKKQLIDKIRGLKKRFMDNMVKSEDGKGPSFTNTEDDEIFKLSMIIWGTKSEKEFGSNENLEQGKDVTNADHEKINENMDQAKDVDVPYAEHERISENVDQAKVDVSDAENERVNENMDIAKDVSCAEHDQVNESVGQAKVNKDVSYADHDQVNESMDQAKEDVSSEEQERVNESVDQAKTDVEHERVSNISMEIDDDGEKEKKSKEDGVDEFCALQDAFEALLFPRFGKTHQKLLLHNLKNLKAEKRRELSDEWKALLAEEVQLHIKKLTFSTKLANTLVSAQYRVNKTKARFFFTLHKISKILQKFPSLIMGSIDSDDSNTDCFEIRYNDRATASSSQRTRKRVVVDEEDEEEVSDKETKLIRKRPRRTTTTTTTLVTSPTPKITWTKDDEHHILKGIVKYEDETELRYRADWDAFCAFIKDSIVTIFTKEQLQSKIRKLKKRFTDNLAKGPSFTNSDDEEMFKLSMVIWGKNNETECDTNVNMDQSKDLALVENEQNNENVEHEQMMENDLALVENEQNNENVEHEQMMENVEQGKEDLTNVEDEQITENVAQEEDATYVEDEHITENMAQEEDLTNVEQDQRNVNVEQAEDATHVEREQINENVEQVMVDDGEKVGEEEFCLLQDAFEMTLFPKLDQAHQKLLLQNLRNMKADKGKELCEEWNELLLEEIRFNINKVTYAAKLSS